jgi:hypothetical protein
VGVLLAAGCPAVDDCKYAGRSYRVGESFPSTDGCNSCSCTDRGEVACTLIACLPPNGGANDAGASKDAAIGNDAAIGKDAAINKDAAVTKDAGEPSDAGASCDFSTSYDYGQVGGFVAWSARSYLSPGNRYRYVRSPVRGAGPETSCAPSLPTCGALDVITAYDIEAHDLMNAEVRAALAEASPPLFGYDQRPVDGQVFELKTASGSSFLVGADCGTRADCRAIPPGIKQIRERLLALDAQQLADPACKTAGLSP